MVAGGPAASLLVGSVALFALLNCPGTAAEPYWRLIGFIALIGLCDFVVNPTPSSVSAAGYTDGAALYQLFRGDRWRINV